MDVQFNERESYFSKDVDVVPLQGEINSKEEKRLWLEENSWWISSKGEDLELDDSRKPECECEETTERPDRLFQQHYSRKTKDTIGVPSPSSDTPHNDITMPSHDSSRIDYEVQNSLPLTSESTTLNPQADQRRRYPLRSYKELDKFGFSKPSSNVVYPISVFVSYHRLCKAHLGFALQLSSMTFPSHFQEALEDPKWKSAMVEEMKALQKNCT